MPISHRAFVDEQGELLMERPVEFDRDLQRYAGKRVWVQVKKRVPSRTLEQNRCYWGWCHQAAQQTGNDLNAIHDALKWMHLPHQTVTIQGRTIELPGTTTTLTVEEMSEYLERCRATLAQDGVYLED